MKVSVASTSALNQQLQIDGIHEPWLVTHLGKGKLKIKTSPVFWENHCLGKAQGISPDVKLACHVAQEAVPLPV